MRLIKATAEMQVTRLTGQQALRHQIRMSSILTPPFLCGGIVLGQGGGRKTICGEIVL